MSQQQQYRIVDTSHKRVKFYLTRDSYASDIPERAEIFSNFSGAYTVAVGENCSHILRFYNHKERRVKLWQGFIWQVEVA